MSNKPAKEKEKEIDPLEERQELIQDVIDRLLSNPEYKTKLRELNAEYPPLKDYNRRLEKYRDDTNNPPDEAGKIAS